MPTGLLFASPQPVCSARRVSSTSTRLEDETGLFAYPQLVQRTGAYPRAVRGWKISTRMGGQVLVLNQYKTGRLGQLVFLSPTCMGRQALILNQYEAGRPSRLFAYPQPVGRQALILEQNEAGRPGRLACLSPTLCGVPGTYPRVRGWKTRPACLLILLESVSLLILTLPASARQRGKARKFTHQPAEAAVACSTYIGTRRPFEHVGKL